MEKNAVFIMWNIPQQNVISVNAIDFFSRGILIAILD